MNDDAFSVALSNWHAKQEEFRARAKQKTAREIYALLTMNACTYAPECPCAKCEIEREDEARADRAVDAEFDYARDNGKEVR